MKKKIIGIMLFMLVSLIQCYAQTGEPPKLLWEISEHRIKMARFSDDGKYVFAIWDNRVHKIDANTGTILSTYNSETFITDFAVSQSNDYIYVSLYLDELQAIVKLDLNEKKVDTIAKITSGPSLELSKDEKYIYATSSEMQWNGSYKYWLNIVDIESKKVINKLENGTSHTRLLNKSNSIILSNQYSSAFVLFSLDSMKPILQFDTEQEASDTYLTCLWIAISDDDRYVGTCSGDSTLAIYDLFEKRLVFKEKLFSNGTSSSAYFLSNSGYIVIGGEPNLRIVDWKTKSIKFTNETEHTGNRYCTVNNLNNKIIFDYGYNLQCITLDTNILCIDEIKEQISMKVNLKQNIMEITIVPTSNNNKLIITDVSGKIIYLKEALGISEQILSIDINTWSNGLYIVSFQNVNKCETLKVIKE